MRKFKFIGDHTDYLYGFKESLIINTFDSHFTPYGWDCTILDCAKNNPSDWQEVFENQSPWISVSDRLPEFESTVLVYCPLWGRYLCNFNRLSDTNWGEWKDFNNAIVLRPTHWMPLPEPPLK